MVILKELLEMLGNDKALIKLLGITKNDPKIYPFATRKIQDCIVYNFLTLSNDGIKEQNRFSLTIISQDMGKALEILEAVKNALLTVADESKTNNILEISLNGGSDPIENLSTGTVHIKAYFLIKNRKVVQ